MTHTSSLVHPQGGRRPALRLLLASCLVAFGLGAALADPSFDAPDAGYKARVRVSGPQQGSPVYAGGAVKLSGQNFKPGQEVLLLRGTTPLLSAPLVADQEGGVSGGFDLPADAAVGIHPLVLVASKPYHAEILDLKISPKVPLSGAELFDATPSKLVRGLYQSAYSARNKALFVTASAGRPPEVQSELLKLDPVTLEVVARATPPAAPGRDGGQGGVFAVYGVGVDDANDTVWVTNTRQDTVAVYRQSDLSLVRQFEPGTVAHARDVVIDQARGKAYVSSTGSPEVAVFDAKAPEFLKTIEIRSGVRGKDVSVGSLDLDAANGKLFTVSLTTGEAVVIDTQTDTVEKVIAVEGALNAIGVAHDPESRRILVAAQDSDNLLIVDLESGKTLHDVKVGAGALNVAFDPVSRWAFVSSRGAGTVTVVDLDGNIVANLENAPLANHVASDGAGAVFAVNKSREADDPQGDRITRITVRK